MKTKKTRLNELRTLVRHLIKEEVQMIKIARSISDEGNKQITISVPGGGLKEGGEIMLSFEEAKQLHQLAEQFLRERRTFSKAVNTKDKNSTQSTIQIQAKGLKCIISRQEGSVYKGYDEPAGSNTGYFVADQSVAYQLVEKLLNNLNEQEGEQQQDKRNADVNALNKAQQNAPAIQNKSKRINTLPEFAGAFKDWISTTSITPDRFPKPSVEKQLRSVLISLGFK